MAIAAGGLVAALIVVGVPAMATTILDGPGQTAAPTTGGDPGRLPSLADLPTRGSLADDGAWVEAVRLLPWSWTAAPGTTPEAPVDTRRVAFAGDVPGARVALVLGGNEEPAAAWFVGRVGSAPEQMTLAAAPSDTIDQAPLALLDVPDPASESRTLVVVAWPGEDASLVTGRSVDARGEIAEHRRVVPMTDGVGAITTDGPPAYPASTQLWVHRTTPVRGSYNPTLTISARALGIGSAADVVDPRNLLGSVRADDLQATVAALAGSLRPAGRGAAADPAGRLGGGGRLTELHGSGRRDLPVGRHHGGAGDPVGDHRRSVGVDVPGRADRGRPGRHAAAGPGDRRAGVRTGRARAHHQRATVRHPRGRHGAGRDDHRQARPTRGATTVRVSANPDGATVRFFDDAGALLATAPITGPVSR